MAEHIPLPSLTRLSALAASGVLLTAALAHATPCTLVGEYSSIIATGEEARGYGVQLWRQGTHYFGLFIAAAGIAGETPAGILEDLRFEPTTKNLSFKARLTLGRTSSDGETWVPSRDLFQFSGTLFPDQITGTLIHVNALMPGRPLGHDPVKLYRSKEKESLLPQPPTYEEWTKWAQQLLERRGPKW